MKTERRGLQKRKLENIVDERSNLIPLTKNKMLEMKWCEHGPKFNSSMDKKMGGQSDPFSIIQFKLLLIVTGYTIQIR